MKRIVIQNVLSLFVAAAALSAPARATEPAEVPGLVAERPATGPAIQTDLGFMVPYTVTIPGSKVTFDMVPIPGGTCRIGSPDGEPGRQPTESPTFEAQIEPFWMARCETSWAEYKLYMALFSPFKEFETRGIRKPADNEADAITSPSRLYDPTFTFDKGDDPRLPAVSMSQYAAKQYTKWLSGLTTQFCRLPTEAEWEHACRAGTTTAYSFGDDPAELDEFGWCHANSGDEPHFVGLKKPNPWGLHDMHGNACEWVLDGGLDDGYSQQAGRQLGWKDAIVWPQEVSPRILRGGTWDSDAADCRSAARLYSDDRAWCETDPNLPKSPWWFTDGPALAVGFRVIRPLHAPAASERGKYWDADVESIRRAVAQRISEGRGAAGVADADLPAALQSLKKPK
ncbi:MAG: formylglycine-generating enzyme family protein [Pirellulales bacterium]